MNHKDKFLKRPRGVGIDSPDFKRWFESWLTETDTGCMEWRGNRVQSGYGQIRLGSGMLTTHKVAWILKRGDVPANKVIRHLCHNRVCCNVNHLKPGTQSENMRDKVYAGRCSVAPDLSQTKPVVTHRKPNMKFGSQEWRDWFYSNTERMPNGCLEWLKGMYRQGYGMVWVDEKPHQAHRIAWSLIHGDIPKGMVIRHKVCDNPPCVDIRHLDIGTQLDNIRDRDSKGRQAIGGSVNTAKLTEGDVIEIRRLYTAGDCSQRKIAEAFGVSQPMISDIVNRKTWKHVA